MISLANPKRNCLLLALIICRCLAFSHSAIDTSKVYKGDFYVDLVSNTDGISGIKAVFTIDASLTEIWGMLNDYHNYKLIYGGIDSLKILEQDKSGILIEFWSDAVIKKIILFYTSLSYSISFL